MPYHNYKKVELKWKDKTAEVQADICKPCSEIITDIIKYRQIYFKDFADMQPADELELWTTGKAKWRIANYLWREIAELV